MFMRPFAHRQLAQRMRAQVQSIKMAHGHFHTLVPEIMTRCLVPVANDVLPRLGQWPINRVAELTPTAWQAAHKQS